MPYIEKDRAEALRKLDSYEDLPGGLDAGDLTWALTECVITHLEENGISFQTLAEATGALEATKLELQRRVQSPYEQTKHAQPGRVDPFRRLARRWVRA